MNSASNHFNFSLPEGSDLVAVREFESQFEKILIGPLRAYARSDSKKLRSKLLFLSAKLSERAGCESQVELIPMINGLTEVIEAIHAGSIIIDDIQDDATERRGQPTLFRQIGIPSAINAGTWLYFWALKKISGMGLRRDIELETYRLCHDALFWAHLGQALDLGFKTDSFDQGSVSGYAKISMQLKTGALTALASELGAIVAGAKESVREAIREFGRNFGIILQSCNDLSEFSKHPIKVSRDLLLDRPTWVLAAAAESLSKSEYKDFQQQVDKLRNLGEVEALVLMKEIKNHKAIKEAQASAKQFLQASFETLKLKLDEHNSGATSSSHWRELEVLGQTMLETYGF